MSVSAPRVSWAVAAAAIGIGLSVVGFTGDVQAQSEGFDKAAAAEALGSVDVGRCKKAKTPAGEGHVVVTFETSGVASGAVVDRGPFKGKVVTCVQKAFKRAKVPPFKGDPMHVGKVFKIE